MSIEFARSKLRAGHSYLFLLFGEDFLHVVAGLQEKRGHQCLSMDRELGVACIENLSCLEVDFLLTLSTV